MKNLFLFLFFLLLLNGPLTFAEESKTESKQAIKIPTTEEIGLSRDPIDVTLGKIITFILGFVGALAVLMVVVGGLMWMFGGMDQDILEDAQEIVTWAVVGLLVALLAWVFVNIIISVF